MTFLDPRAVDYDRLLELRLAVARHGEMDVASWWNTKGMLGRYGAMVLARGRWSVAGDRWAVGEMRKMKVKSYRDLILWQKGMDLVEAVYRVTKAFPREEMHCLSSQIRRAAVSVPSNIAEGQGRNSTREFRNHLSMACGSLQEVETQVLVAQRLEYLDEKGAEAILGLTAEVGRLTNALSSSLLKKLVTTTLHRPPATDP